MKPKVTVTEIPPGDPLIKDYGEVVVVGGQRYIAESRKYGGTRIQLRRLRWHEKLLFWLRDLRGSK